VYIALYMLVFTISNKFAFTLFTLTVKYILVWFS